MAKNEEDWNMNINYMGSKLGKRNFQSYLLNRSAILRGENVQRKHFPEALPIAEQPLCYIGGQWSERTRYVHMIHIKKNSPNSYWISTLSDFAGLKELP